MKRKYRMWTVVSAAETKGQYLWGVYESQDEAQEEAKYSQDRVVRCTVVLDKPKRKGKRK
ncbi:MAG: hypothetical protein KGL39_14565 [Patescibacteria group bacterium]|nr:hypothetical protein [Patescibacteria group bacterium]